MIVTDERDIVYPPCSDWEPGDEPSVADVLAHQHRENERQRRESMLIASLVIAVLLGIVSMGATIYTGDARALLVAMLCAFYTYKVQP